MKNIIIALLLVVVIAGGYFMYTTYNRDTRTEPNTEQTESTNNSETAIPTTTLEDIVGTTTSERPPEEVIGRSVQGKDIVAYHFGQGERELLLIGNTHGSDAANTAALADEFVTYFKANPAAIPADLTVTIIPRLNPDGLANQSRFNQNQVDLNRNFDCDWAAKSQWRNQEVSGGSAAFSEPEAAALRDYVNDHTIDAAVAWFAAEGKVYPSACDSEPSSQSIALSNLFATASMYPSGEQFNAYPINGDMVNWLAKEDIPAISVLLSDRTNTEWDKNLKGVEAILKQLAD